MLLSTLITVSLSLTHFVQASEHHSHSWHKRSAPTGLDPAIIRIIKHRLAINSTDSWVSGARIQALLEYDDPTLSVFSNKYTKVFKAHRPVPKEVLGIVEGWQQIHNSSEFIWLPNDSPTDGMSVGIGFIIAAETHPNPRKRANYTRSIDLAEDYVWDGIKRNEDGAMSTRPQREPFQTWSDMISMLPPFLAYDGVWRHNVTQVQEAFHQIKLYRDILYNPEHRAWRHVMLGEWQDEKTWSTGNAWAAHGCARVAATILNGPYAKRLLKEAVTLLFWSQEIVKTAFSQIDPKTGLVNNEYFPTNGTFGDSASSALLVATAYRLAAFGLPEAVALLPTVQQVRKRIHSYIDRKTGWVRHSVNPFQWYETGNSPESLAFVLDMEAAVRDLQINKRNRLLQSHLGIDINVKLDLADFGGIL